MNPDFIQLKSIEGDLKISQKKHSYGVTVSTKEIVLHKPHINYHIKLADIISIVPFQVKGSRSIAMENRREEHAEYISTTVEAEQYRLDVRAALVHNRSGLKAMGRMQFVFPIQKKLMEVVASYSGLNQFS